MQASFRRSGKDKRLPIAISLTVHAGKFKRKDLKATHPYILDCIVHAGKLQEESEGQKRLPIPVSLSIHAGKLQEEWEGQKGYPSLISLTVHAGNLQEEGPKGYPSHYPWLYSTCRQASGGEGGTKKVTHPYILDCTCRQAARGGAKRLPIPISLTVHAGKLQKEGQKCLSMSKFIRKTKKTVIRQYWRNRKKRTIWECLFRCYQSTK